MRLYHQLLLIGIVAVAVCNAKSKNLYPRCASDELSAQAVGGQTVSVKTLTETPSELILACIAVDVAPPAGSESACSVAHQTDYNYRLFLAASYTDAQGTQQTTEYDLKDVAGGSVNRIHVTLPSAGTFVLRFQNLHQSSCSLKVRVMLETAIGSALATVQPNPVLIGVRPPVVYTASTSYAYFLFRHVTSSIGARNDAVVLIDSTKSCDDVDTLTASGATLDLALATNQDAGYAAAIAGIDNINTVSARKIYFDRTGTFRICYNKLESAFVSVYSGNPSYYTFEGGQGPQGQIYVGREVTVRFHGYGLDTRPDGDQAKFVKDGETCDAAPAGGVRVATDLGPADDWGPNTKFTEWKWTLTAVGSFKICYKRRHHSWVEVPSIDELGPGAIEQTLPPQAPVPTPTDPISKEDCPLAPNGDEAKVAYPTLLKVTLTTSAVPPSYLSTLSRLLCLPVTATSISRQGHSATGHVVLWLSIQCDPAGSTTRTPCNAQERKNYAVHLMESQSPLLQQLHWESAQLSSQDDIFGVEDDSLLAGVMHDNRTRHAFFVGCATLIVVAAMVVYGVLKYREKRHYFVQFGMDDEEACGEDADVDLEIDEHGRIAKRPLPHVENATIELELDE